MDEWMDEYITKHFGGMDVFGNVRGGAMVKWVRSLHTIVALLWELYGQIGEGGMEKGDTQALCANYGHK